MSELLGLLKLGASALLPVLSAALCGAWMRELTEWEEAQWEWVVAWGGLFFLVYCLFDCFFYFFSLGKKLGEIEWIKREGEAHLEILQKFVDAMQEKGGSDGE